MIKALSFLLSDPLYPVIFIGLVILVGGLLKFTKKVIGFLVTCGLAYLLLTFIVK